MKSDLIDLEVYVHAKTSKAILISDDGDSDKAVWVPLSQVEVEAVKGRVHEVTMPEWLASEKGLI